jgi:hypothetical protein
MANEIVESKINLLGPRERAAYRLSISRKEPFLSPTLADQFYNLYQSGKTCEEIQALNPNISLGMIVRASVDFDWNEKRQTYFDGLMARAKQQAQQLSLESLSFLSDLLNAFHTHDRIKLQKFIQTGDVQEMRDVLALSGGIKLYKEAMELLFRLTGQGGETKKVQGTVEHIHTVEQVTVPKTISSEEAARLLASIDVEKK